MNKPIAALLGSLALTSCGGIFCVARGTLVSTPRGRRPIEDLVELDTVWCVDPLTGEKVASLITRLARATREVMRLQGEGFSLTCTTDHPLYDPTAKAWSPAGDWVLGQRSELLLVPDEGAPRVVAVHTREVSAGLSEVIDLSVQHELHNFVAAGVLVHNKARPTIVQSCNVESDGVVRTLRNIDPCVFTDGGVGRVQCLRALDGSTQPNGTCEIVEQP